MVLSFVAFEPIPGFVQILMVKYVAWLGVKIFSELYIF